MTSIGLALASLRYRPLRTGLTVFSVTLAIGVLTVTLAVIRKMDELHRNAHEEPRLVATSIITDNRLPLAHCERLRKEPGISAVYWLRTFPGDKDRYRFSIMAVSEEQVERVPSKLLIVPPELKQRWHADRLGLLVSPRLMSQMGWHAGDRVGYHAPFGDLEGNVIGTADGYLATANDVIVAHYDYVNEMLRTDKDRVNICTMQLERPDEMDKIAQRIDELFQNSSDPTMSFPLEQHLAANLSRAAMVPELLSKVGILLLLVTGLITASTLGMSLRERRAEFGVLRALGFTQGRVFGNILLESTLICLTGGLLGAVVPFLLYRHEGLTMGGWGLGNITVTPTTCFLGLVVSAALGTVVAVVPAFGVARQDVIRALE